MKRRDVPGISLTHPRDVPCLASLFLSRIQVPPRTRNPQPFPRPGHLGGGHSLPGSPPRRPRPLYRAPVAPGRVPYPGASPPGRRPDTAASSRPAVAGLLARPARRAVATPATLDGWPPPIVERAQSHGTPPTAASSSRRGCGRWYRPLSSPDADRDGRGRADPLRPRRNRFVRQRGIVTGAFTIGVGVTGPVLARLIDRRGTRRVLVPAALVTAAALVASSCSARQGAGTVPLVVAAALAGAGTPPVGGVLRQQWPRLVPERDLETAYALDAVSMEVNFVTGPLLAGSCAATAGPRVGLLVAAALGVVGVSPSTACSPSRPARTRGRAPLARRDALAAAGRARLRRDPAGARCSARSTSPCPPSAPTTAPPRWAGR